MMKKIFKRILVVEDELDLGEIMQIALSQAGYEVKILLNGKDIESHISKFSPSLIMMDLWMPGLDGVALTKKIKANKKTRNIPVVLVSARNGLEKTTKSCGADDFLPKPFNLSDLLSLAKKFV